jgi:hypothetical protein
MTVYKLVAVERQGSGGADITMIDPANPAEYDWLVLSPAETVHAVVAMLRTLEQPEREHAVALAQAELQEFIAERMLSAVGVRRFQKEPD